MSFAEDEGYYYNDGNEDYGADPNNLLTTLSILLVVRVTNKAYLVKLTEGNKTVEYWFPKSKCILASDEKSIEVPWWLLDAKRLEGSTTFEN